MRESDTKMGWWTSCVSQPSVSEPSRLRKSMATTVHGPRSAFAGATCKRTAGDNGTRACRNNGDTRRTAPTVRVSSDARGWRHTAPIPPHSLCTCIDALQASILRSILSRIPRMSSRCCCNGPHGYGPSGPCARGLSGPTLKVEAVAEFGLCSATAAPSDNLQGDGRPKGGRGREPASLRVFGSPARRGRLVAG
jgi:hypothetical protein